MSEPIPAWGVAMIIFLVVVYVVFLAAALYGVWKLLLRLFP